MKHTDAAIYYLSIHTTLILALIQNLRHSCGKRLNNTMHFICTQMFDHTGDSALTLPRVKQPSVQQGEILANILSAYNKKHCWSSEVEQIIFDYKMCTSNPPKASKEPFRFSDSNSPSTTERKEWTKKKPRWDLSGDLSPLAGLYGWLTVRYDDFPEFLGNVYKGNSWRADPELLNKMS